jgi:hypothetical protein
MAIYKKGDRVKILGTKNLYWGAGDGFKYSKNAVKRGAILKIKDEPRTSQNALFYKRGSSKKKNDTNTWLDIIDSDGTHGWIAVTSTVSKTSVTKLTRIDGTTYGLKIYVNGKELSNYPITQDENGSSHKWLTYADGTLQYALDHGDMKVDYAVTLNDDCKLTYRASNAGNYIVVQPVNYPEFKLMFVHVYEHFSNTIGKVCKKGKAICKIAPTTQNGGSEIHLHDSARKNGKAYKIRNVIYS